MSSSIRLACDTGGTFTDLIVEHSDGSLKMFKSPTTPDDPVLGVIGALKIAAADADRSLENFLSDAHTFIHGTTHAINAIITERTAKTALITTQGHRDMLVLREGGRADPFSMLQPFPRPYIPRALSFTVPERIGVGGKVISPLNEDAVLKIIEKLDTLKVEAVAVCLLWSIANPVHELRIGKLLQGQLPTVPFTLSHELNPALREYRRASSAAIDASLKPIMASYLNSLTSRLTELGFAGRLLVLTSQGGMMDSDELARAPIHAINSGPSLAPIAGRKFADTEVTSGDIIVADTGGTTYDVSLVRGGTIPLTRETWIGQPYVGHITGFPSVDVKSVGAGGGSIARIDSGGILDVGPQSAGASPGPACYGKGGSEPTLTDACVVMGYLDPDYFLGGAIPLDRDAAFKAVEEKVAKPLGSTIEQAAASILTVATENMVQAIADITVNQGIDPADAVLVGGGGAAGFNAVFIARRLGIRTLVVPEVGAALSAAGALMSELASDHRATQLMTTKNMDAETANAVLEKLEREGRAFLAASSADQAAQNIEFSVEARYEHQVWEIEVPLPLRRFDSDEDVVKFVETFHCAHERIFAFRDEISPIEIVNWSARASVRLHNGTFGRLASGGTTHTRQDHRREILLPDAKTYVPFRTIADIVHFENMTIGQWRSGPAIVETPFTSIVIDVVSEFQRAENGSLIITLHKKT